MPQIRFKPKTQSPVRFTPASSEPKRPIGASGEWDSPLMAFGKDVVKTVTDPRNIARGIGMAGGAAVGAPAGLPGMVAGAAAGSSVGESLYQIGEHALELPTASKTPQEAAGRQTNALLEGAAAPLMGEVLSGAATAMKPITDPAKRFVAQTAHKVLDPLSRMVQRESETLFTRALRPNDLHFQHYIREGMSEIKATLDRIGKGYNTKQAANAGQQTIGNLNAKVDEILSPQSNIVVPGSRNALNAAEVAAIPEHIRLLDPKAFESLAKSVSRGDDLTLGDLNTVTVSINKMLRSFYAKGGGEQMTAEMMAPIAKLEAQGDTARQLLYEGMDSAGRGGGLVVADLKQRIGAVMHMTAQFDRQINRSVAEKTPIVERALEDIARVNPLPVLWGRSAPMGRSDLLILDKEVNAGFRRWRYKPRPIADVKLRPERKMLEGGFPMGAGPETASVTVIPAQAAPGTRAERLGLLLPPHRAAIPMGAAPDGSYVRGIPEPTDSPRFYTVRQTGMGKKKKK